MIESDEPTNVIWSASSYRQVMNGILAERDFPEEERYHGYIQLENGVGMMRLLKTVFHYALEALKHNDNYQT